MVARVRERTAENRLTQEPQPLVSDCLGAMALT